jgi:hypothetical protein
VLRVLVASIVAVAGFAAGDAVSAPSTASVHLAKLSPVTVAGSGFAPRERVVVRVIPAGRVPLSKVVSATAAGRFAAAFVGRSLPECASYRVVAVGNAGSRAARREIPPPGACGIVLTP